MKTKAVAKLPKCDFCGKDAIYDVPTKQGPWGNLCEGCYKIHSGSEIGTKFQQREPKTHNTDNKVKAAVIVSSLEDCVFDSIMEVECPECGEGRNVEPDADYTFECEGCGQKCKVNNPLF